MPRYRVTIEYDGAGFVGWQLQANGLSIQECIEVAIERFSGESVRVYGAGRTDAGVHALGQVAHFDLDRDAPADTVRDAVNYHLKPAPIAILDATRAPDDFDARIDARRRSYFYRIVNRRPPLALDVHRAWHVVPQLDADAMDAAAQMVLGRHDFTTFRAAACQARSPVKTLDRLDVRRDGDEIRVVAEARSFLHHQVRNMVGALKLIGEGRWQADGMKVALEARDRAAGGPTAPPDGLYLARIDYGDSRVTSSNRRRARSRARG